MSDPVHDAILELVDDMIARVESVQSENRTLRGRLDEVERRSAEAETRAAQLDARGGPQGRGVERAEVRDGRLWLRYTDGDEQDAGAVAGDKGEDATIDPDRIRSLIREEMPEPKPGKDGESGRGVAAAELRGGDLHLRLTDGAEINVGRVVGEAGQDAVVNLDEVAERAAALIPIPQDGKDADPVDTAAIVQEVRAMIPTPKDGTDGIATREELEALIEERFADLQVRTLADSWRGVYREGETYQRGSVAQWGGSPWLCIAAAETTAKPGTSPDWQLFAKKGADAPKR